MEAAKLLRELSGQWWMALLGREGEETGVRVMESEFVFRAWEMTKILMIYES